MEDKESKRINENKLENIHLMNGNKFLESLENYDKTNLLSTHFTRTFINNKETIDLTFGESPVIAENSHNLSNSTYFRFHKILTESFEIEDDLNDIPSKTVKEIPVFLTNKVLKYRNLVFPHRMFDNQ